MINFRSTLLAVGTVAAILLPACRRTAFASEQHLTPGTISLDGDWEIVFDPESKGREAG